jgi:hypothetical protein
VPNSARAEPGVDASAYDGAADSGRGASSRSPTSAGAPRREDTIMKLAIVVAVVATTLALAPRRADAEDGVAAGPQIAVEPTAIVPIGELADTTGIGFGLSGTLGFPLSGKLVLTGRVGLAYHLAKDDISLLVAPLVGGLEYAFSPNQRAATWPPRWGRRGREPRSTAAASM